MKWVSFLGITMLTILSISAQEIDQYASFDEFESAFLVDDEEVQVINFWATWCAPCIKELPYFEELDSQLDYQLVLVSIDFANQYESRLLTFIKKKGYKSKIVHLADPKPNDWIDRVDPSWSGAIPATLLRYKGQSLFLEQEFTSYEELRDEIQGFVGEVDSQK